MFGNWTFGTLVFTVLVFTVTLKVRANTDLIHQTGGNNSLRRTAAAVQLQVLLTVWVDVLRLFAFVSMLHQRSTAPAARFALPSN